MDESERNDVLRRKARTGREEHKARVMSPPRALRLAIARAADEIFDMALTVSQIRLDHLSQEQALAAFQDDRLLMVLDGPNGAIGAASVDLSILSGLIEMQTMGKVVGGASGSRQPTQTDAALVAPLLDASLRGFVENLAGEAEAAWAEGVRFGARVESRRMLALLVEAADFHLFRMEVALGDGAREGHIVIALPDMPRTEERPRRARTSTARPGGRTLGQGALLAAEAPLTAVLHRIRMPLGRDLGAETRRSAAGAARDADRYKARGPAGTLACANAGWGRSTGFAAVRMGGRWRRGGPGVRSGNAGRAAGCKPAGRGGVCTSCPAECRAS